jgi:Rogdi leucine zipper containing protein
VKMHNLAPTKGFPCYKLALSTDGPERCLVLDQLAEVRNLVNQSLDVVDVSTWTGDPKDANFISGQLRLLYDNMHEARQALKVTDGNKLFPHNPVDATVIYLSTQLVGIQESNGLKDIRLPPS